MEAHIDYVQIPLKFHATMIKMRGTTEAAKPKICDL
jgi:hypothetical protein